LINKQKTPAKVYRETKAKPFAFVSLKTSSPLYFGAVYSAYSQPLCSTENSSPNEKRIFAFPFFLSMIASYDIRIL